MEYSENEFTAAKPNTRLNKNELHHFKSLLLKKRDLARKQLEELEENISNLSDLDDADYSSVAHHMGDVGSDVEETDLNYALAERTTKYLQQIDEALQRIENKTYGICMATGKPIAKGRLEAVPHTRYSIEAKQKGMVEDI